MATSKKKEPDEAVVDQTVALTGNEEKVNEKIALISEARAELRAEVEKILAEAKAEAAKIISEAEDAVKEGRRVETPEEKTERDRMAEPVEIELFKDDDKYSGDVFVGVNGKGYIIKRGIPVRVPRFVAEVVNNSLNQQKAAAAMIRELENEYKTKESALET